MKGYPEKLARELPPDGAREVYARIRAAKDKARAQHVGDSFDIRVVVDEAGNVSVEVPRRYDWRAKTA